MYCCDFLFFDGWCVVEYFCVLIVDWCYLFLVCMYGFCGFLGIGGDVFVGLLVD